MIEILTGIGLFIVAEISKLTGLSTTYIVGIICLILGFIYTFINIHNPDLIVELTKYIGLSFATSQTIWMAYNKVRQNKDNG